MPQQPHLFESQTPRLGYLLHLPPDYKAGTNQKWPLILFLHGKGERGDNLELVKKHGIARIVEEQPDFPFIAVSPQCPDTSWWPEETPALKALLDFILLTDCDGDVTFTIYKGVTHDSWTQTYANPELYEWFLSHTRS
jgi:predicted peptidase